VPAASSFFQVSDSVCAAKKRLEAYRLQNFVYDEMRGMDSDKPADELRSAPEYVPIPEYALDRRTRRGKVVGKTKAEFFKDQQAVLFPWSREGVILVLGPFCSGTMS